MYILRYQSPMIDFTFYDGGDDDGHRNVHIQKIHTHVYTCNNRNDNILLEYFRNSIFFRSLLFRILRNEQCPSHICNNDNCNKILLRGMQFLQLCDVHARNHLIEKKNYKKN